MKKKFTIYLAFVLILSLSFVSGAVVINEVESNPDDETMEYVELYNSGNSEVDLSGWMIEDSRGRIDVIPNGTSISSKRFFVFNELISTLDFLNNESIVLRNEHGALVDVAPFLADSQNDLMTWQRIPDGSGDFVFAAGTEGLPNELTVISNKYEDLNCVFAGDDIVLNVNVSGFCIEEVIFSVLIDGVWENYSGVDDGEGVYSLFLDAGNFSSSELIEWTVFSRDCFSRIEQDGVEDFYVNSQTELLIDPASPDGLEEWYVSEPEFILINDDANMLFYRWDSLLFLKGVLLLEILDWRKSLIMATLPAVFWNLIIGAIFVTNRRRKVFCLILILLIPLLRTWFLMME